ncbi:MAG: hypothetical protein A4E57_04893 [Syntrophorhabdaceae bacterium PtaU1.Bin034]|nr:MAG: hypothetical protein A4E57_04893 [Syntrophorhabdaceae bacterium PtaU1.Bin034]
MRVETTLSGHHRIEAIDMVRGLAVMVMLLDHTRLFFHNASLHIDPTDLSRTSAALFLTRWITHPVAPIFVFLAGTAAFLRTERGKTEHRLSRFLLTRGLWLVVLEFTIVRLGINFNFDYHRFFGSMQVIWVIGVSMMLLALLVRLPAAVVAAVGIVMIGAHNLLDGIHVASWKGPRSAAPDLLDVIWLVLHQPGAFILCPYPCPRIFVLYPLIPWVGVMAAGFAFGAVYRLHAERRRRFLIWTGLALMSAFVVLRTFNIYGDPQPWQAQTSSLFTIFSFLDVTKYPPSLLFLLMTLGPGLLILALFERVRPGKWGTVLSTFGKVPLFFYLLQFFVAHGLAVLAGFVAGQPIAYQFAPYRKAPPGVGFDLWVVYLFWVVGLVMLYPVCRWFAALKKRRRRDWWLSYL